MMKNNKELICFQSTKHVGPKQQQKHYHQQNSKQCVPLSNAIWNACSDNKPVKLCKFTTCAQKQQFPPFAQHKIYFQHINFDDTQKKKKTECNRSSSFFFLSVAHTLYAYEIIIVKLPSKNLRPLCNKIQPLVVSHKLV